MGSHEDTVEELSSTGHSHRLTRVAKPRSKNDLLAYPWIRSIFTSHLYPTAIQGIFALGLFTTLAYAFFGTIRGSTSLATVALWSLWWPLLPISLLLFGRSWCSLCPFPLIAGGVQKLAKPHRQPSPMWRRWGIWWMAIAFVFLTWADRVWSFTTSPRATGILLLVLLVGAVGASLFYKRLAWCRYLCPIGAMTGLYSMNAVVELRANGYACRECRTKDCYQGNSRVEGCPLYEFPGAMTTNTNCSLCGNCVKACPYDAIELRARWPGQELWNLRKAHFGEAALALMLVALVYIQTIDMTMPWSQYMKWLLENTMLSDYNFAFTVNFLGIIALALGAYMVTAYVSSRQPGRRFSLDFAYFGYAYLPLALGGHLGHNLSHITGEGPGALQVVLDQLRTPLGVSQPPTIAGMAPPGPLALALVLLGLAMSLYIVWRMSQSSKEGQPHPQAVAHTVLLLVLGGLYLMMFLLPMNPRHTH